MNTVFVFLVALMLFFSSTPASAAVFWDEDWEESPSVISDSAHWGEYSCSPGSWPSTSNPGLSTTRAFSGTHSLKHHFAGHQPLGGGCFMDRHFTFQPNEIYVRWWEYIDIGFQFDATSTKTIKPGDNYAGHWWSYLWGGNQMVFTCQTCKDAAEGAYGTENYYHNLATGASPLGKWACHEWRLKYNTPNVSDGLLEGWITVDGVETKHTSYTGRQWRGASTGDPLPSNAGWDFLREYVQDGVGDIYRDKLAVGSTRIGCDGTPPPSDTTPPPVPAAPTIPSTNLPATYNWVAVVDPGDLAGYTIFRKLEVCAGGGGFTQIATIGNVLTFQDTTIPNVTTSICAKIASRDVVGNLSALSAGTDETLTPPGTGDTFAHINSIVTDGAGANLGFTGLASSIRYRYDHPGDPTGSTWVVVAGLGGATTLRLNVAWPPSTTYMCVAAQGSDGIWENDIDPLSYGCSSVTPANADVTAPATPQSLTVE